MRWFTEDRQYLPAVIAAAKTATIHCPEKVSGWIGLATALYNSKAKETARDTLLEGIRHLPNEARLYLALAKANARLFQYDRGLEAVNEAVRLAPGNEPARLYRLTLLFWIARERAETGEQYRLLELVQACDTLLAVNPGHTEATYYKALTLAKLGRRDEARAVLTLDRHISIQDLPAPGVYADNAAFCRDLTDEVTKNPLVKNSPKDAGQDFSVTGALLMPDGSATAVLIEQIKTAFEQYVIDLPDDNTGFVAAEPKQAKLRTWAVICGQRGQQALHHHPNGWVSGVFYTASPEDRGRHRGPLVIGAVDDDGRGAEPPWGIISVDPKPGRLVMFPSFVPHRTEPSGLSGARISIAFDVVPIRERRKSIC